MKEQGQGDDAANVYVILLDSNDLSIGRANAHATNNTRMSRGGVMMLQMYT